MKQFEILPMPTELDIPEWIEDMRIDWMEGWSNRPRTLLKCAQGCHDWPHEQWHYEQNTWTTMSDDGRLKQFGAGPAEELNEGDGHTKPGWMTKQERGFAGRWFEIQAEPNAVPRPELTCRVYLRGPWHGSAPAGYVEVSTFEPEYRAKDRNWWECTGCFGLFITNQLWARCMARMYPDHKIAFVIEDGWVPRLEPMKPEWTEPKMWSRK